MSSVNEDAPYTVNGELLVIGKKNIICRCPKTLRRLLEADVQYAPIADFKSSIKDDKDKSNTITLFDIRIKDRFYTPEAGGLPRTYQVIFELPLSFNRFVCEGPYGPEVDTQTTMVASYFDELNSLLQCWSTVMQQKLSVDNVNFYVPTTWRMKYPWKKVTVSDYFGNFNAETSRHRVNIGVGYHNLKESKMGISLQLSQFPSIPPKPTKKRKVDDVVAAEAEAETEAQGDSEEVLITTSRQKLV
jgi:hypothetical protein